jgi:hypothetical protein
MSAVQSSSRVVVRRLLVPAVLCAAATGVVVSAGPASALPGVVTPQITSAIDSTAEKVVEVPCPLGTKALGGSAVVGGSSRIGVNAVVPGQDSSGRSSYTVLAREQHGGTGNSWEVVATGLCAPSTSVPGLEYVRTSSVFDSMSSHQALAVCSPGKKVVGVGGLVDSHGPGQDALVLTAVRPGPDLTSVSAAADEAPVGYSGPWRVTAVAVCAYPVPGLYRASAFTTVDSTDAKRAEAACPTGTRVLSGGFDIGSAAGHVEVSNTFLDPDLTDDPTHQGAETQARENGTGYTGTWRVGAFAVCAA